MNTAKTWKKMCLRHKYQVLDENYWTLDLERSPSWKMLLDSDKSLNIFIVSVAFCSQKWFLQTSASILGILKALRVQPFLKVTWKRWKLLKLHENFHISASFKVKLFPNFPVTWDVTFAKASSKEVPRAPTAPTKIHASLAMAVIETEL